MGQTEEQIESEVALAQEHDLSWWAMQVIPCAGHGLSRRGGHQRGRLCGTLLLGIEEPMLLQVIRDRARRIAQGNLLDAEVAASGRKDAG